MNGSGLTASDVLAMTKDKDGIFGGDGVGFIILLFIFIWAVFGGNGFGFGGKAGNALTQAELQAGLYNQTMDRNLSDIRTAQCNTDMLVNNTNYNNLLQSKELSAQLAECCCTSRYEALQNTNALMTQMNNNTNAILNKMCENEITTLRDRLADRDRDLQTAEFQLSQINQNQSLINALRPTPIPAYATCSPYMSSYYANFGTGCNGCGNTLY